MINYNTAIGYLALSNIGSFWSHAFDDQDAILSALYANAFDNEQAAINELEADKSLARQDIDVFHLDLWYYSKIVESDITSNEVALNLYNGEASYGDNISYGDFYNDGYKLALNNSKIKSIGFIVDNPKNPNFVWVNGIDFKLANGYVYLDQDPKDYINLEADTEGNFISLWFGLVQVDTNNIFNQFGYQIDKWANSSDLYKQIINATWDTIVLGSNMISFRQAVGAIHGISTVKEDSEIVEYVITRSDKLQIITDQHAYEFPVTATSAVSVGDTVYKGDFLITAITILENDFDALRSNITLWFEDSDFIADIGLDGVLGFKNASTPLHAIKDSDDFIEASFNIYE